jgi:hypothetical protein
MPRFTSHTSRATTTVRARRPDGIYTLRIRGTADSPFGEPTPAELVALASERGGTMRYVGRSGRADVFPLDGEAAARFVCDVL